MLCERGKQGILPDCNTLTRSLLTAAQSLETLQHGNAGTAGGHKNNSCHYIHSELHLCKSLGPPTPAPFLNLDFIVKF